MVPPLSPLLPVSVGGVEFLGNVCMDAGVALKPAEEGKGGGVEEILLGGLALGGGCLHPDSLYPVVSVVVRSALASCRGEMPLSCYSDPSWSLSSSLK